MNFPRLQKRIVMVSELRVEHRHHRAFSVYVFPAVCCVGKKVGRDAGPAHVRVGADSASSRSPATRKSVVLELASSELLLTWARIYDIFNIVIVTTPENLHRDPAALAAGKGTMCL